MKQALERRYKRLVNGEGQMPIFCYRWWKRAVECCEDYTRRIGVVGVTIIGVAKGDAKSWF
ncbi:MAG: hypothetical protein CM15mP51_21040 [Porticoccaceae bacterium]|nr:MAG: hypothetical protein CM15mP51_21040 [Porticoccaceae bacterium]